MSPLFQKLNWRAAPRLHVLNAPVSFEAELARLEGVAIERVVSPVTEVSFGLAFAVTQVELDTASAAFAAAAPGDATLWIAYPKGSSKRYRCEFNRDSGWSVLGAAGFEPVRQVAIDEDWSALRFRRVEFIKAMKRSGAMALSEQGKARTAQAKRSVDRITPPSTST
jgi:hypothetical protein